MHHRLSARDEQVLEEIEQYLQQSKDNFLGYPISKNLDFSRLNSFNQYPINNVGDPFVGSTWKVHTHQLEREVIDFFAKLYHAPEDDYWGYVTNGSSESNLYALYLAREIYPDAIVYASSASHYSISKNSHLLNISYKTVNTIGTGEMDYQHFEQLVTKNCHKPVIVLATFGTTMTEAKDNVTIIKDILHRQGIKSYFIHCDAALAGGYAPFIQPNLPFNFNDGIDSICVSGHKFIGSPFPCGALITRRSYRDKIANNVSYIGSSDSTITGSRNGHSPLFLWYSIKTLGVDGLLARYQESLEIVDYCQSQLLELGIKAWRNPGAITLIFPKIIDSLKEKYQLATQENLTHIVCMPSTTKKNIDDFINDYKLLNKI